METRRKATKAVLINYTKLHIRKTRISSSSPCSNHVAPSAANHWGCSRRMQEGVILGATALVKSAGTSFSARRPPYVAIEGGTFAPAPTGVRVRRSRWGRSASVVAAAVRHALSHHVPLRAKGAAVNPKHECRLDLGNEATVVVPLVDTVAHCGVHALEKAQGELAHATPVGQHERRNAVNLIRSLCLILVDLTPLGLISNAVLLVCLKQSPLRPSTSKRAWSY